MKKCEVETPFGGLRCVDDFNEDILSGLNIKFEEAENYEPDNTTELQLPFIKYYFPLSEIVIYRIPPNNSALMFAQNLFSTIIAKKINCIIIASTDLTHYGYRFNFMPAGRGRKGVEWVKSVNDKKIIEYALNLNSESIIQTANNDHNSCCGGAFAAGVEYARLSGCKNGHLLNYFTSSDVLLDEVPDDFVGYCGIIY